MKFSEVKRILNLCCYEDDLFSMGYDLIAGIDEAGRGSLAGPLVAAAVVLDRKQLLLEHINDSKKLSEKKRDLLFKKITRACVCWSVAKVAPSEIDRHNISKANLLAFKRAVDGLKIRPDIILSDFINIKNDDSSSHFSTGFIPIVNGDEKSVSIAAASIVAKVTRDRIMKKMSRSFPGYEFEKNKGYGTRKHLLSLQKYGPTNIHRMSFKGVLN